MREFNNSGIEWLGLYPKEWEMTKLKYLCHIDTGSKDTQDKIEDGLYPFFVRSPHIEKLNEYTHAEEAVMTAGDGVGVGKVFHYYKGKFAVHQRVYVFTKFKKVLGKFIYYFLYTNLAFEVLSGNAKSTVDSLRRPMLANFPVVVPPINEQNKIIAFLDLKLEEIDKLIKFKKTLIKLLEEKRQAMITDTVTKGLNPNVKMKDSGVEWIGKIPEHWEMKKVKYLISEKLSYGANISAELDDPSLPRYIRITDIDSNGELKEETFKSIPHEVAKQYEVKKGDILLARTGATVGKSYFHENDEVASYAGYLIKLRTNSFDLSKFIYYFTNSSVYFSWIKSILIQATIQNVSAEKYANLKIPIPPKEEVITINNYLEENEAQIRNIIRDISLQIEKLKEYRQSLVYEAVTGKIDVRAIEFD